MTIDDITIVADDARPRDDDETPGAIDINIELTVAGGCTVEGEVTLCPGCDERLASWGDSYDYWMSSELCRAVGALPNRLSAEIVREIEWMARIEAE